MSEVVIEVSLIVVIDTEECDPPTLWPWDEMFDLVPGADLAEAGFRVINPSANEIN